MIGILIALGISWLLLWTLEKKSLLALGVLPLPLRLKQFATGFLVTALLCVLAQYLERSLMSSEWLLNENASLTLILQSFWWDFKSVLTEELLFRGALLYILNQRLGTRLSILISAIAFGMYHWFSYGVLGSVMPMIFVFIGTGLMGYAWAWAFTKTKSMLLPFGLHLGWNFCYNTIFSHGPLGEIFIIPTGGTELADIPALINFLTGLVGVPILVLLYVRFFVRASAD